MTALLLAEPEESMRGFLERQLSSDGFDVLAFRSPDELPRAVEPDVLLLGDPDALDRCVLTDCPVIVLGSADTQTRLRALERCDDYLTKPFSYEELVGSLPTSCAVSCKVSSNLPSGVCRLCFCRSEPFAGPRLLTSGASQGAPGAPKVNREQGPTPRVLLSRGGGGSRGG